jgi:hypothetical protein
VAKRQVTEHRFEMKPNEAHRSNTK